MGISLIVFFLLRALSGDPPQRIAGEMEAVESIRSQLGLNRPLHLPYGIFISKLARLNLGRSARTWGR
jgi:ABC-type dipeptide/oligopeptide/nickel transport system permease component